MPQAAGIGCVARTEAASFGVFPWPEKQSHSEHNENVLEITVEGKSKVYTSTPLNKRLM